MGMLGDKPDLSTAGNISIEGSPCADQGRSSPGDDAMGRPPSITPEEQARDARAIAEFIERLLSMPDEDPPGAWDEAMHDLDAQRPHRKLFEGLYE